MAKKQVNKLSDKLTKVNESFTVNMYDNGYMIEVGGRDEEDEWKTAKIMVSTVDQLIELIKEATSITRVD
jgi:ketol-acid reductoisomerase